MFSSIRDKIVIVTGASSGIGKALAIECGRRKAKVVLAARREELLRKTAATINDMGSETLVVIADVSIESDCERIVTETIARFGTIDVLINNAGVSMRAMFHKTNPDVLRRVIDINFWGMVNCTRFALPWLLKSEGSVVGISSVGGFKGLPGRTAYSASKFAMHGFLEALRTENMKNGLHVLIVCPGFTSTEIREKALKADGSLQGKSPRNEKRMMNPEQVAHRTLEAVINRRRLLILTLEGKFIIALQRLFPTLLDKIVYRRMAKEPDSPFN